jgi:hypothetical protein
MIDTRRLILTTVTISLLALIFTVSALAAGDDPVLLQGATPSPTPQGQISLPTATPTRVGGPTATPSHTPTNTPVIAHLDGDPTNLRSGPGLDFEIIATLDRGTELPLIGRWLGHDWYLVRWDLAPGGQAWVFAGLVVVVGDETTVPAVEPPQLPTIDPTLDAIQQTATVILQTPGAQETATAAALFAPTGVYTATPDASGGFGGIAPTFTAPPPYLQPDALSAPNGDDRSGIPPATVIVSLGLMGMLTLVVGLLRRI